jgi:hypothetical protein
MPPAPIRSLRPLGKPADGFVVAALPFVAIVTVFEPTGDFAHTDARYRNRLLLMSSYDNLITGSEMNLANWSNVQMCSS